ncbi:DNA polymerase III subunit beta family protein [Nocardiopsis ganjiahuensis]|uniref:DNA polymerase III subunit beta family protein n=1 Tax=Nocardiopsis ganjiahuensis TaxID=239984 RepID=UPI00034A0E21|nr:MerR family transcriptional regulator [Nocardiopsis ganjiahuensis]
MPNDELMPIGVFAQRSGLTSSALRFYADSGLLRPAEVDPVSGYRYYSAGQVARATALRRLREIAMPLAGVEEVLDADPAEASRLIDGHVAKVLGEAEAARHRAAAAKASLSVPDAGEAPPIEPPGLPIAALKGPVLADAVEQVLTATAREPGAPVLSGVRVEASQEALTLTATDRYRLSVRTLVPAEPPAMTWAATLDGGQLRDAAAEVRRSALVRIEAAPHGVWFRLTGRGDRYCGTLSEVFPDYRLMLASLPEATTRATVPKEPLLRALEEHPGERVALHVSAHGVAVLSEETVDGDHPATRLPAATSGPELRIRFELTTLYPAVSTAVGPDVLFDLRGSEQPVTIRSADRGDLTTLAMPVRPTHPT